MKGNRRIAELLVQSGAFMDLSEPVILTSGELGIYYINTEKLCPDNGEFARYGDNSAAMIAHVRGMMEEHPSFKEVVGILKSQTELLFPLGSTAPRAISGGQRRDWIFSGPVAAELCLPHISLYKNGKIEVVTPEGQISSPDSLSGWYDVHIVDLLTEGSSAYRVESGEEQGWVPMLRQRGAAIDDILAVVSRRQGGEERLTQRGVTVHPIVTLDAAFLREHSSNPQRAVAYINDPSGWSERYLREHGAIAFIDTFDSEGGKLDRAKRFLERYGALLRQDGMRGTEFQGAIKERYGKSLTEIVGGK